MERRKDLDFAKGVGIVLMVLGHSYSAGNGESLLRWLYSFHMPLFFIVPGIVSASYSAKESAGIWSVIQKKARRLLVPYFFFATIASILLCVIGRKTLDTFGTYMWRIATLQGINAMWFLPCFLFAEILMKAVKGKTGTYGNYLAAILGILAVFVPIVKEAAPMLQRVLIGASFCGLGWILAKPYTVRINKAVWAVCAIAHLILAKANGLVDLAYGVYGNAILYYMNGLLGTFVVVQFYHMVRETMADRLLVWLGQNTIVVLCTSSLVIEIIRLLDYKLFDNMLPRCGFWEGVLMCAITMLAEVPIILFCNKYLQFAVGKGKRVKSENGARGTADT